MSIAKNLQAEIDTRGISAARLADAIGADALTVRRYLTGKARPSDDVIVRMASVLGCKPEEIKHGHGRAKFGKLTTSEVSRITGIDELSLRIGCQRGIYPFGTAYKRKGSTQYTYIYDPGKVRTWAEARKALTEVWNGRYEYADAGSHDCRRA